MNGNRQWGNSIAGFCKICHNSCTNNTIRYYVNLKVKKVKNKVDLLFVNKNVDIVYKC